MDWVKLSYIGACSRAAEAARAYELHKAHFASHLPPPIKGNTDSAGTASHDRARHSLAHVMNAFARRGERAAAEKLLDDALALGMPALPHHVNALLLACSRESDAAAALRTFEERFGQGGGPAPDQHSYILLLKACAFGGDIEGAVRVREQAKAAGLAVGTQTDLLVIRSFLQAGEMGSAWRLYEEMRSTHGVPNLTAIDILTRACWTASQDASDDKERALWMQRALSLFADGQALVKARQEMSPALAREHRASTGMHSAADGDGDVHWE